MDKISVLGLLLGMVAIIGGQVLEGGHVSSLTQPTALLIVLGGTLGAVMMRPSCAVSGWHAGSGFRLCWIIYS